jgi:hypothetical protein
MLEARRARAEVLARHVGHGEPERHDRHEPGLDDAQADRQDALPQIHLGLPVRRRSCIVREE